MKRKNYNDKLNQVTTEHNIEWLSYCHGLIIPSLEGRSTPFIPAIDDPCLQDDLVKISDRALLLIDEFTMDFTTKSSGGDNEMLQKAELGTKLITDALGVVIRKYGTREARLNSPQYYYFSLPDVAIQCLSAGVVFTTQLLDKFTHNIDTMSTKEKKAYARDAEIVNEFGSTLVKRLQEMNDEGVEILERVMQAQVTLQGIADRALGTANV